MPRGYAIVNIDPRGVGDSEDDIRWWGTGEGQDGHDAIEELAKLPWSNGKIGMAGNSWLAISQYSSRLSIRRISQLLPRWKVNPIFSEKTASVGVFPGRHLHVQLPISCRVDNNRRT